MRQWEIYDFPHPSAGNPHPCVVLSPPGLLNNPQLLGVNVLPCQSLRGREAPKPAEVRLNGADGLDGHTIVKCQYVFYYKKADAGALRGIVTQARQREIKRKLVDILGLYVSRPASTRSSPAMMASLWRPGRKSSRPCEGYPAPLDPAKDWAIVGIRDVAGWAKGPSF